MKTVHIVTHAHWDREWYLPFEAHRARLVDLIDDCMGRLESDPDFKFFHLDGQTIPLEDYLEIKPQNRERIKRLVEADKLKVGPWYILQDEFITSSESNVRNLLIGMQIAEDFGSVNMIGYLPDSFGNAGQMPQLFKQAGLKTAVFGRGVKPTGMANQVYDFDSYQSKYSEMYWQSPDGSRVPAILFANWYANGKEMPGKEADEQSVREWWSSRITAMEKYAATDELLLMNGGDHTPIQSHFGESIEEAKRLFPEYAFVHSHLENYIDTVAKKLPDDVGTVYGELTSQDTSGYGTLVGTCSTLSRIKRMNRECEMLLENGAEPLSVMASTVGKEYPKDMLRYAWKSLMKNHPHDSVCGCNCDDVNLDVERRYANCRHVANAIIAPTLEYLAASVDTSAFSECDAVFTVINTYGRAKSGEISLTVDTERLYGQPLLTASRNQLLSRAPESFTVVDAQGNEVAATVEPLDPRFGYYLPSDKFRRSYFARSYKVTLLAKDVPALGAKTYGLKRGAYAKRTSLVSEPGAIENALIKVKINADGTVDLTDKHSGRVFAGLVRYEDVGDNGNEYNFGAMNDVDSPILSTDFKPEIKLVRDEEYLAEYKIRTKMTVPASAHGSIDRQIMLWDAKPKERSQELVTLDIETYLTLEQGARSIRVRTVINNTARDHRLRVVIPTGIDCKTHRAESLFEAALRPNRHKPTWQNPCEAEHHQGFVTMKGEGTGLAVANIGVYEYEILKDNAIALTLLRSTGEIRDWGVFPTELSQSLGVTELCYCIAPFDSEDEGFATAISMHYPLFTAQNLRHGANDLGAGIMDDLTPTAALRTDGILKWSGDSIRLSALKKAEDGDGYVARFVNYALEDRELRILRSDWFDRINRSTVIEANGDAIPEHDGAFTVTLGTHEILTVRIR